MMGVQVAKPIEVPVRFTFKGERPYINISTMFSGLLDALRDLHRFPQTAVLNVDNMKAVKELASHGNLRLALGTTSLPISDQTVLTMVGSIDGLPIAAVLDADLAASAVPREAGGREKLLVRNLQVHGPFSGRAELVELQDAADLILAFVEANKQLHEASVSPQGNKPKVRFGYLGQYSTPLETDLAGLVLPIDIEHVTSRSRGDRVHTLNRLTLHLPDRRMCSVLSFNYY